jgi:hypothetical protein
MSHWAEIDNSNTVLRVLVGDNADPAGDEGYQWLLDNLGGTWIKTSYNATIRKNYAGVGFQYDSERDAFIPPKPECHPDAITFDEATCLWSCPDATHVVIQGEENV